MGITLRCGSPICPAAQTVGTLIAWKFHWSLYSGSLGVALAASTRTLKSGSHTVISASHHTCLTALRAQLTCKQKPFPVPVLLNLADQWWESRTVYKDEGRCDERCSWPWRASRDADCSAKVHALQQAVQPTRIELLEVLAELLGT